MENIRYKNRAIRLCHGGMICLAISANLPPVYLTTFADAFASAAPLTNEQLGRIPSATFMGLVLGIVLSGPLADRWGAKAFAIAGVALTGIGLILLGLASHYETLLASAVVMGFGAGIIDMVMSPIISVLESERRASALNWLHSFYCIGAVATTAAASAAIAIGIPWRIVVFAAVSLPLALAAGFLVTPLPPLVHENAERQPIPHLLRQPIFIAALIALLLAGATEVGLAQWLPTYAERNLGYSRSIGGAALAAFSIGMAIGRILAGKYGHRISPITLVIYIATTTTLLLIVGTFSPYPATAIAACVLTGLTISPIWPTLLGVAGDRFPHGGASLFGLLAGAGNTGCFIAPWLIGALSQQIGLVNSLACLAPCAFLLAILAPILRPKHDNFSNNGPLVNTSHPE